MELKTKTIDVSKQMFEPEQRKSILALGGNELLLELLSDFKAETDPFILELSKANKNSDIKTIKQHAHSIKGSAKILFRCSGK